LYKSSIQFVVYVKDAL